MPITGAGLTQALADALYIKKAGDSMVGDLTFPSNGFIMTDGNGVLWRVTIDTTGHLVTNSLNTGGAGGWLSLGFTNFDS